jgi:hypothetical protein
MMTPTARKDLPLGRKCVIFEVVRRVIQSFYAGSMRGDALIGLFLFRTFELRVSFFPPSSQLFSTFDGQNFVSLHLLMFTEVKGKCHPAVAGSCLLFSTVLDWNRIPPRRIGVNLMP